MNPRRTQLFLMMRSSSRPSASGGSSISLRSTPPPALHRRRAVGRPGNRLSRRRLRRPAGRPLEGLVRHALPTRLPGNHLRHLPDYLAGRHPLDPAGAGRVPRAQRRKDQTSSSISARSAASRGSTILYEPGARADTMDAHFQRLCVRNHALQGLHPALGRRHTLGVGAPHAPRRRPRHGRPLHRAPGHRPGVSLPAVQPGAGRYASVGLGAVSASGGDQRTTAPRAALSAFSLPISKTTRPGRCTTLTPFGTETPTSASSSGTGRRTILTPKWS